MKNTITIQLTLEDGAIQEMEIRTKPPLSEEGSFTLPEPKTAITDDSEVYN